MSIISFKKFLIRETDEYEYKPHELPYALAYGDNGLGTESAVRNARKLHSTQAAIEGNNPHAAKQAMARVKMIGQNIRSLARNHSVTPEGIKTQHQDAKHPVIYNTLKAHEGLEDALEKRNWDSFHSIAGKLNDALNHVETHAHKVANDK